MVVSLAMAFGMGLLVQDSSKIDDRVSSGLGAGRQVPVFVMMQDQFVPPGVFDVWADKNIDGDRLALRKEVVASLKSREKKTIVIAHDVLGKDADVRQAWLVNGFATVLDEKQAQALAARSEVMYIYPVGQLPPTEQSGTTPDIQIPKDRKQPTEVPWNVVKIGAQRVHDELKITGKGSVVAMFEAGVHIDNDGLRGSVWVNEDEVPNNGKDDDHNGYVDDRFGWDFAQMSPDVRGPAGRASNHGTMTSGIVAGWSDTKAIAIAPDAKIMPVSGGGIFGTMLAFQYAVENGADVVNMSYSIPDLGNTRGLWRLMAEHATAAGLVLVSGAGNFQQSEQVPVQIRIPEGIPCVVCAGGVDENDEVPRFCSLGPVEWASVKFYNDYPMPKGLVKPDVCGFPGAGYPVLDPTKDGGLIDPNDKVRGNSFSGPHISGVVAMMFQADPHLTPMKVKQILEQTARDIAPPGKDDRTGAGLADAYKAVKEALTLARNKGATSPFSK